jgi:hypothetical protein
MYVKAIITAGAVFAFIAVTEAKIDVEAVKKTFARDAARIKAREVKSLSTNKVIDNAHRLGQSIQTSPTYVTVSLYGTTDCASIQPYSAVIYGTNTCLPISSSTGVTAGSTQYLWDSTNNMLREVYYSDDACVTSNGMGIVYDFTSDDVAGICYYGVEFTTSSTYDFPGHGYAVE